MKKPNFTSLFVLIFICFSFTGKTQTLFAEITGISITPVNPDPTDSIFIQFSGNLYDSCTINTSAVAITNANSIGVSLEFQQLIPPPPGLHCINTLIPWDTTFNVGPLAPGTYPIYMSGSGYENTLTFFDLQVNVPTPACVDNSGTIWVTNTNDQGVGSLRNAINCANTELGPNLIRFNIFGSSDHHINVGVGTGDALPALIDVGTVIDGTTQPGYGLNGDNSPKIILNGAHTIWTAPINALWIQGNNCQIFGLEIINFPDDGIDVMGADNVIIGSFGAGNIIYNNGSDQDFFIDAPNSGPWNGCGIVVRDGATACSISGNIIGTNEDLDDGLGNEWCGIIVRNGADNSQIGGLAIGQGNIISGNETGVRVSNADHCLMQRNSFSCNTIYGIELNGGANNNILGPGIDYTLVNEVSGTSAVQNGTIEIFVNDITACQGAPCQGKILLGTTTVNNGVWGLNPPFLNGIVLQGGERITATVSDATRTSAFADCKVVAGVSACTNVDGTIDVTTTDDEGPGSLREAINCANSTLGANLIRFNIPGTGPHIISVGETSGDALPTLLDDATVIDGSTQPGFGTNNNNPQIILDGQIPDWTAPINALFIQGDFCEIYALQIVNFPDDGIDLTSANYCKIGSIAKGNVLFNNGDPQDFFPDAPNTGPWNGCGIVLKNGASYNEIKGNIIGTNAGQTETSGNEYCGIIIASGSNFNTIGDTLKDGGNIIAYNEQGIRISGNTNSNSIQRNSIYCNTIQGINLLLDANNAVAAPGIGQASIDTIAGIASVNSGQVEIFINDDNTCANAPCQGKTFLGKTSVVNGVWTLLSPYDNGLLLNGGESITAVFTDQNDNSSEFSTCVNVEIPCNVQISIFDQTDASCGLDNGSITVEAIDGQAPYLFDIGLGLTTDSVFNDLSAGSYTITVFDQVGCNASVSTILLNSTPPTLTEGINNDATCLQANGSFSALAADGTPPYTYDIGNGPTSDTLFANLSAGNYTVTVSDDLGCTATLSTTINDVGLPTLTITEMVDATCGQTNGSITVMGSGGTAPYLYDIGNGPVANPVFTNLSPGNYSITLTDDNGCTTTAGAIIDNIGVLPVAGFNYIGVDATVTFTNTSSDALTYSWDFGDGNTSTDTDPVHTYTQDGSFQVCLTASNTCGQDVLCDLVDIVVPLAEVTISGEIAKENGETVALVEVNCTSVPTQTTLIDGYYEFNNVTVGMDYTVTPYKNTIAFNGINVLDLVLIQKHIIKLDTLDSPYKIIAADATNNQEISIGDLVILQRFLLQDLDTFPNNTSWRFVPADHVFPNLINPFESPFPESITFINLMADAIDQDFVAIKVGDVSGDSDPAQLLNNAELELNTAEQFLKAGTEITVDIHARQFEKMIGFQAGIQFDPEVLELVNVTGGILPQLQWGTSKLEEGLIPVIWYDESGNVEGINIDPDADIINLTFKVNQSGGKLSDVMNLNYSKIKNLAYDIEKQGNPVYLIFDNTTSSLNAKSTSFQLGQNQPNPFSQTSLIPFELPTGGSVSFRVYEVTGRLVHSQQSYFGAGKQVMELSSDDFPVAGLYFYEMEFEGQKITQRMIVR